MKLFSTNGCAVPKDLSTITTIDYAQEDAAEMGGLNSAQVDKIWHAVTNLYQTGVSPAITFCLRRKGHIVLNRAIGHSYGNGPEDFANTPKQLATPNTPICLFSASKVITALLIHLLAEQGKINLLDPISKYIPEYGIKGKKRATIYHLLAHKGGIPSIGDNVDPNLLYDFDGIIKLLCNAELHTPSGHDVAYHAITAGYLLAEIIRRVTGLTAREYLHEYIQKPMGMTYFNYGLSSTQKRDAAINYATGFKPLGPVNAYLKYIIGGDLEMAVNMTNDPRFSDTICPSANIFATAEECSRFFQMLLDGGRYKDQQILHPDTIQRAIIEAGKPVFDRRLLIPIRYSLGCMLGANPVGLFGPMTKRAFGHLGFSFIFCWADPSRDISISILTSGKALIGPHLPALGQLLTTINWQCRPK
jgi:CubicO group peptidase (beta-lactamase class C family)